jgi:2-methylfumaryl-CoA isomerase
MYGLLKGLRVVEGAAFIAGPSCGLHLAQMGAEVIRFDNIGGGPDFRRWPLAEGGASLYWEGLNKGKKSVALDLSRPEGRELAVALATAPGSEGGLFVTNFPVEGFLAYERLRPRRPDLVCVRIMGWADGAPAVDYTVNAAAGVPLMTGPPELDRPVNHVLPAWDLLAGAYAAFALLAAAHDRMRTGSGREVRIPLSDLAAASLSHLGQVAEVALSGADRPKSGNDLFGAFGRDFATRDGRVMVVAITPRQWSGLLETLGVTADVQALEAGLGVDFAADEGLRFRHRERLNLLLEAAFARLDMASLAPAFAQKGVCWAPYQTLHQAVTSDDRLFRANPVFSDVTHPSGGAYPTAGAAATLIPDVRGGAARAPRLGEHTDEVLGEVLGLPAVEIGRLHDAGLVAGAGSDR